MLGTCWCATFGISVSNSFMASLKLTTFTSSDKTHVVVSDRPRRNYRLQGLHLLPGAEIVTFLPLQMSLYFNVFYSPLWVISSIFALENKFSDLAVHYKFIDVIVYIIMFTVEVSRLYFGYEGNLREKVPELAGFWLLTLLQTPLTIYLMINIDTIILPLERSINIVLLLFLILQLVLGIRALQLMVRAQAVKFHLTRFDELEDISLPEVTSL